MSRSKTEFRSWDTKDTSGVFRTRSLQTTKTTNPKFNTSLTGHEVLDRLDYRISSNFNLGRILATFEREISLDSGGDATVTLNHNLGVRPSFVGGYEVLDTGSGTADNLGETGPIPHFRPDRSVAAFWNINISNVTNSTLTLSVGFDDIANGRIRFKLYLFQESVEG